MKFFLLHLTDIFKWWMDMFNLQGTEVGKRGHNLVIKKIGQGSIGWPKKLFRYISFWEYMARRMVKKQNGQIKKWSKMDMVNDKNGQK